MRSFRRVAFINSSVGDRLPSKAMTDAEFMAAWVARERKEMVLVYDAEYQAKREPELDALEALANLPCDRDVEFDEDEIATIICHKCEAIRAFREKMEGK